MPQAFKKYKNKKNDGRYKILPEQYPEVIALYKSLKSSRKVAKLFGVTKSIILFIVNPEQKERDRQRKIRDKDWLYHYNKDYHTKDLLSL